MGADRQLVSLSNEYLIYTCIPDNTEATTAGLLTDYTLLDY